MPMLTTLRIGLPVWPSHAPERTRSAKAAIRSSTACTSGTTSWPSTTIVLALGRPQRDVQHGPVLGDVDVLAAEHGVDASSRTPARRARATSSRIVSAVMRFFE